MVIKNIDFEKYNKMAEKSFYRKLGKVVNVVGLTIESAGPDSKLGDLCRILPDAEGARPIMAEVVGFRDKKTLLMPYDSVDGIGLGCVVENTGDPLKVTVNDKLLGKTVNGLGVPIDGEMINGAAYPVEAAPPDPMSRTIIDQVLPLGVKAVDGMITVGKGQRIGIFAGSGVGKSTLMRRVAALAQEAGEPVEYILCSGDPDSLDAILLPGKKAALVDGTAPHGTAPLGHPVKKSGFARGCGIDFWTAPAPGTVTWDTFMGQAFKNRRNCLKKLTRYGS